MTTPPFAAPPAATQPSLFEDDATCGNAIVRVGVLGSATTLTRAQKDFNRWSATVEEQRQRVAEWKAFGETFGSVLARDLEPLERQLAERRIALLRRFDSAHDGDELTKRERNRLATVIVDLAADLLEESDDPDLVALHDKYSRTGHEELRRGQIDAVRAMAEETFGVDLSAHDLQSPEDVFEALRRHATQPAPWERGNDTGAARGAASEAAEQAAPASIRSRQRPRSAKALAREARERAAAEGANLSVREVYRKLASALHPDREPDSAERGRKTLLMQRVNQAYDARDLLQLLTLQIEVEQIDLKRLTDIGDDRLEHYNRVLKEQSANLARELEALIEPFRMSVRGRSAKSLTPALVSSALQAEVATLRRDLQEMARELETFKDPRRLKAWLKSLRIPRASDPDSFDELQALMAMSMAAIDPRDPSGAAATRRRKRR
jgi:hypothetical protein